MTAGPAIEVRDLTKRYGSFDTLRGVEFDVGHGEVFSLLGPNGAGKTTTVEILEGFRRRDGGAVQVLGTDPANSSAGWRDRIGVVPQSTGSFAELTVDEVVRHFATFYARPLPPAEVVDTVGLTEKRRTRGVQLSGGQRRRLDLALGIVGDPDLVFLDEPTTGLDPIARRETWDLIRRMAAAGKTILLTTHYLDEAEALANRVAVIVAGRIVAAGTPADLGGRSAGQARVSFRMLPQLGDRLPPLPAGTALDPQPGRTVLVTRTPTAVVAALARWAQDRGIPELPELTVSRPTLEDIYFQLIREHGHPPEGDHEQ